MFFQGVFMWIPEISIHSWLQLFPALSKELPLKCVCGKESSTLQPFVIKNWIGLWRDSCDCGLGKTSISIPRSKDLSNALTSAIISMSCYDE
jgi:hypothetical protein